MKIDNQNYENHEFKTEIRDTEFTGYLRKCTFEEPLNNVIFSINTNNIDFKNKVFEAKFSGGSDFTFHNHVENADFQQEIPNIKFKSTASKIKIHANYSTLFPEIISNFTISNTQLNGGNFKNKTIENLNFIYATAIQNCDFSGAIFNEILDLSQLDVGKNVLFCEIINNEIKNPATFKKPPNFVNTQFGDLGDHISSDTLIDKADFSQITHNGEDYAIRSWKLLQNFYSQTGNSEGARKFFELELKEKTKKKALTIMEKIEKYVNIFFTYTYGLISDYGYSISKPLIGLAIIFSFYCSTSNLKNALNKISPIDYSSIYHIGITGTEIIVQKASIQLSDSEYFANILMKFVILILWFLLSLGIRNKYKIK